MKKKSVEYESHSCLMHGDEDSLITHMGPGVLTSHRQPQGFPRKWSEHKNKYTVP